jgi:hypothetical protein
MERLKPGSAPPLTQQGFDAALEAAGLERSEAAAIWAVIDVETAGVTQGFGFRPDRLPQLLFERHKFQEFTDGVFDHVDPDISGSAGGPYGSLAGQLHRLYRAVDLCEARGMPTEAAYKSASWGIGQVMGFNHKDARYASAREMARAMCTTEDAQLHAMAGFLESNGLAEKIRRRDWAGFARIYNGPKYARNQYDVKLEAAHERLASGSAPDLRVRAAQAGLLLQHYSPGKIDGVLGKRTRDALLAYQANRGLPATGVLDDDTYDDLMVTSGFAGAAVPVDP